MCSLPGPGIEATDLSSLLEQFEKTEGADAACHPPRDSLCPAGLPRLLVFLVVGWEHGGAGQCCLRAGVTLPGCFVLEVSLHQSPSWPVKVARGPQDSQEGGEEPMKERGCTASLCREQSLGCCEASPWQCLGCYVCVPVRRVCPLSS